MFCPKCKSEYREGFTVCSSCKILLVDELSRDSLSAGQRDKEKFLHPSQYLNDLEEWGKHQYDPGYWTGGNIPPYITYGGKKIGVVFLLSGVSLLIYTLIPLFNTRIDNAEDLLVNILNLTLNMLIGIVLALAGIKKLKKTKN